MSRATATAEIDVASIAAGGDGVGRADGMAVFIPRSAPGDRVLAALTPKGRFARGEIESILRPAPTRVPPPCPHYLIDRCGGCQLQHMEYSAQLAAKRGIVIDSLARIARRTAAVADVEPSEQQWRYRRKLTLAMRRHGGRWIAGLHPYDDPDAVFDLRDCPITDERVVDVWADILRASARLPKTTRLRGAVRLLHEGASFVLEGGDVWPTAQIFFDAVPALRELWWAPEDQWRRLIATRGDATRSGASFEQINVAVGEALHDYVVERVASYAPEIVIDAYSGTGLTAARIAATGAQVTAIESDRDAAAIAGERLPAGSRSLTGRVEDLLDRALPADVVVLNPPRSGIDARAAAALEARLDAARAIIYVSCDAATLARDLSRMPRFRIAGIKCFDMFPQTAHVETVCELVPERT
jgi:23S rRNA (uracil1939-C5)-methyltransferase